MQLRKNVKRRMEYSFDATLANGRDDNAEMT